MLEQEVAVFLGGLVALAERQGRPLEGLDKLDSDTRAAVMNRINGLVTHLAQRHYPTGKGAVIRPTGNMVMYIAILLAAYLWLLLSFPH